jgi:hypothetical protein
MSDIKHENGKIQIKYMFSAGFRCIAAQNLIKHNLRKCSSPFDYLIIDLETVFRIIHGNFENYLKNIVIFNKNQNLAYEVEALNELQKKDTVCYMGINYNAMDLRINTNYIDETLSENLYEWKKICIFHHHNICDEALCSTLTRRTSRFQKIIEDFSENTCLFYITKIETIEDIDKYMDNIAFLKINYTIKTYLIMIVCCDNLDNTVYFRDSILFIIKKVEPYNIQIHSERKTDNNYDYSYEFDIMRHYFDFQLVHFN